MESVSVSQGLLLGMAVMMLFPISVYATGRAARTVGILDVGFVESAWATVFKNVGWLAAVWLTQSFLPLTSSVLAMGLLAVAVPIVVYARVLGAAWGKASLLWLIVLGIEIVAAFVLVLGALTLGGWLDVRFGIPELLALATPIGG